MVVTKDNGDVAISNPENVKEPDDQTATATPIAIVALGGTVNSEELQVKDFDFSVPIQSVICGVEVRVKRKASSFISASVGSDLGAKDKQVMLLKGGNTAGVNTAKNDVWKPSDYTGYTQYGGSAGLWGTTFTPMEVNDKEFGVSLALSFTGLASAFPTAEIDHIEMVVYYQPINVLPILIAGFDAEVQNEKVHLSWDLPQQHKGSILSIERTTDFQEWITIHKQILTSNVAARHSIDDEPAQQGSYYYRLKLLMPDGSVQYSKELMKNIATVTATPTLFVQKGNKLFVSHLFKGSPAYLFNNSGQRLLLYMPNATATSAIEISHLSTGVYYLSINGKTQKFFKQ